VNGQKSAPMPGLWEPKWIGKGYRIPTKCPSSANASAGPQFHLRFHIRRGHFRYLPGKVGTGKQNQIWIEAYVAGVKAGGGSVTGL